MKQIFWVHYPPSYSLSETPALFFFQSLVIIVCIYIINLFYSSYLLKLVLSMHRNQKIKLANPLYGRGCLIEQKENSNGNSGGFRKANRPLIPDNPADIECWEPKIMSSNDISVLARYCVEVTDAFIKLDNYVDSVKKYNASSHALLRMQRSQRQLDSTTANPEKYTEQIVQCVANPDKFVGTRHCLELVIGSRALEEFIQRNEWTQETLKDFDIDTNWKFDPTEAGPSIPVYNGLYSS